MRRINRIGAVVSTEAKSPPPPGDTAVPALAALSGAPAQTFAVGAGAAVAAGIAAFFIPRAAARPAATAAAPPERTAALMGWTGRAPRLMTGGVTDMFSSPDSRKPDRRPQPGRPL
jgi:hypothetical protein